MGKLWLRRTDLFIPFGSRSGKRLQSLSFQSWPWPLTELPGECPRLQQALPGSPAGAGAGGGSEQRQLQTPGTAPCQLYLQSKEGKTKLLFPGPTLLLSKNVFWCKPKLREPRETRANTMLWEHRLPSLPALGSGSPVPVLFSNEMLPLALVLL